MMKYIFVCITFLFISANAFGYDVCVDGIFYNINNSTREASVTYRSSSYNSYAGKIIIPEEIHVNDKDYKVVKIIQYAFSGCIELEEITIPSSVTLISHDVFSNCPKLKKVYFYCKGGEVEERAFKGATNIKEVHIKDLYDFMNVQFYGGNPVRTSHDLYLNGNLITELNIPESVTTIKHYAFQGCSVRSINFPETVKELGIASFSECNNLTTVILPPSLKTIANSSFSYCKNLISVTIPRSVEKLEGAFENCKNLKKIICETEQVPVTDYMEFYQIDFAECVLYVRESLMNEYRNTFPWSQFVNIKPLGATGIRQTEQDERSCPLYDLSGKRISKPIKGVYVRNGKKQVTINTIK